MLKMVKFRLITGSLFAVGLLMWQPACAQRIEQPIRPVAPLQKQLPGTMPPVKDPAVLGAALFRNISATLVGPGTVKIEWSLFPGADAYCVFRNGNPIGPSPQATCPTVTQGTTAYDNNVPANSTLKYYVTAAQKTTVTINQPLIPGTNQPAPNPQSHTITEERTMPGGTSNTVAVVVPPVPVARWALRPESPPSIAPNSAVLIFVPGMDSRTEEADEITNQLFNVIRTTPFSPPPANLPQIKANSATVSFATPEVCDADHMDDFSSGKRVARATPDYFQPIIPPPPQLLDTPPLAGTQINVPPGHNLGINEGRLTPLLRGAAATAQPLHSLTLAATFFATGNPSDAVLGNAFADLSVTGRKSFAIFRQAPPGETFCQSLAGQGKGDVVGGCRTALDRAYRVANFLRTGQRGDTPALKAGKTAERNALGWIAVSGEDDSPHRPVNVPSSDFPQYDLLVPVPLSPPGQPVVSVHTRYTIAQSQMPGRNLVVISVDLPTSGYADNLNYNVISPLSAIGQPKEPNDFGATGATPLLDFIAAFVVDFAVTLDQTVPFRNNIKAVMGGSLGGNITFRLGRWPNVPWLPEFVVWSPASIWPSLAGGGLENAVGHITVRKAWFNTDQVMNSPAPTDRQAFFGSWDQVIFPILVPVAQSDTWTSNYYPCKATSIAGARQDRQETYDAMFLAWHWRLATEQLIYSHQTKNSAGQPLFTENHKPMLLACGLEDNVLTNDICKNTQSTAQQMSTPGKAVFLSQTGHSLDNERRTYWAQQIVAFLGL
jgi:hypothetical protein